MEWDVRRVGAGSELGHAPRSKTPRTNRHLRPGTPESLEFHAGHHPRAPRGVPGTLRYSPRLGEINVQAKANDHGKQCARDRHADDTGPDVRRQRVAAPSVRDGGCEIAKYPTRG